MNDSVSSYEICCYDFSRVYIPSIICVSKDYFVSLYCCSREALSEICSHNFSRYYMIGEDTSECINIFFHKKCFNGPSWELSKCIIYRSKYGKWSFRRKSFREISCKYRTYECCMYIRSYSNIYYCFWLCSRYKRNKT